MPINTRIDQRPWCLRVSHPERASPRRLRSHRKAEQSISSNPTCPFKILPRASSIENHPPRSTSGNSCICPDRGGHSISNTLLRKSAASNSPATAHAATTFPPGCLIVPTSRKSPSTAKPVSSQNSRLAASSPSSPTSYSPFGIDQAPRSFLAQKGPPGCTRNTSSPSPRRRYTISPALRFAIDGSASTSNICNLIYMHIPCTCATLDTWLPQQSPSAPTAEP